MTDKTTNSNTKDHYIRPGPYKSWIPLIEKKIDISLNNIPLYLSNEVDGYTGILNQNNNKYLDIVLFNTDIGFCIELAFKMLLISEFKPFMYTHKTLIVYNKLTEFTKTELKNIKIEVFNQNFDSISLKKRLKIIDEYCTSPNVKYMNINPAKYKDENIEYRPTGQYTAFSVYDRVSLIKFTFQLVLYSIIKTLVSSHLFSAESEKYPNGAIFKNLESICIECSKKENNIKMINCDSIMYVFKQEILNLSEIPVRNTFIGNKLVNGDCKERFKMCVEKYLKDDFSLEFWWEFWITIRSLCLKYPHLIFKNKYEFNEENNAK